MKKTSWLLAMLLSLALAGPSPFAGGGVIADLGLRKVVVAPALEDNLALLFSQFSTELVLCLEGERRGPDLYITDFRMPHILASEPGRVQATGCSADRGTVGTWHNHPISGLSLTAGGATAVRNCYLSRTDVRDFLRRHDAVVSIVSCAPYIYAYWWRRDVEGTPGDAALLPPPHGQLVSNEKADRDEASALTQAR